VNTPYRTVSRFVLGLTALATALAVAGPADAAPRTLFGVSVAGVSGETAAQTVARTRAQFGSLPVARIFDDMPPDSWSANPRLAALGTGSSVVYSVKGGDIGAVAAGSLDARMSAFLRSKPGGVTVYVALHHEPEDDVAQGTFTAAQFVAATARLAPVIRSAGGVPTTILMAYTAQPGSGRNWRDYYTPAVDVLAWDAYNTAATAKVPGYRDLDSMVAAVAAVARETGKPFGWAELGSPCIASDPNCTGRAAWLTAVGGAMSRAGASFVTYWNRSALSGPSDYALRDAPSVSAWRDLIQRG
jgi:hypothetical protein